MADKTNQQKIHDRLVIMSSEFDMILEHWTSQDAKENTKRVSTMAYNGFNRLEELSNE